MFNLIHEKLSPLFKDAEQLGIIAWKDPCDCCGRPSHLFNNTGRVFDGSSMTQVLCDTCALFVQSNAKMGFENGETPYRLNSFKGGYLIIPTGDEPCEIWLGGKYTTRFKNTPELVLKPISGHAANLALLADKREKLVISLSPRRELFLRNLRLSDENNLFIATEEGCLHVRLKDMSLFERILSCPKKKDNEALAYALSSVKKGFPTKKAADNLEGLYERLSDADLNALSLAGNYPDSLIFIVNSLKTR